MFDLEQEIKEWKRALAKYPSLTDGVLRDMEMHLRDALAEGQQAGRTDEAAFREAVRQVGRPVDIAGEFTRNCELALDRRRPWRPSRFLPALWGNSIKVMLRKTRRQLGYSLLTLAGLTIGLAAFLLIALYCRFERSYDAFNQNADRIFRVQNDRLSATKRDQSAACPLGLGPALKKEFPEVVEFARLFDASGDSNVVTRPSNGAAVDGRSGSIEAFYEKRVFYADPSLLRIFTFPLVEGDAATALDAPDALVMTESTARKYFGQENPLRQTLIVNTALGKLNCRVTGVCRDLPPNSHFKFDLLMSFSGLTAIWPEMETDGRWTNNAFQTYVLLSPQADQAALEAKFPGLIKAYPLEGRSVKRELHLQPLRSIHLNSRLRHEVDVNGEAKTVGFLELISVFILLIAWINAVNLATARSLQRGKEVCVRKTLGACRGQLAGQFLLEAVFHNAVALLVALGLAAALLPLFSRLVDRPLSLAQFGDGWLWMGLSILAGAVLSGLYPAFVLSSFQPAFALRGAATGLTRGAFLRKALVLFQFVLAVGLISATLIVGKQLAFVRSQDLGAELERTLVLKIPPTPPIQQAATTARNQLASLSTVTAASALMGIPGREYAASTSVFSNQGDNKKSGQNYFVCEVDEAYFPFFGIPLVSGRNFSGNPEADQAGVVINEEARKSLGFTSDEQAIQQEVTVSGYSTARIIGVVRDYHHRSLRDKIEPILFLPLRGGELSENFLGDVSLCLKYQGFAENLIPAVEQKWRTLFPNQPLEYFFLDAEFERQYDGDRRFGEVFGLASLLAVTIACLGLFGLATFSAERRTREIGVRKVFGASTGHITAMLAGEFTRGVFLANLLAWPLAYWAMQSWLEGFAYRTSIGLSVFLLAGGVTLLVAGLTVATQAVRTARQNPVQSLRSE